jgi:hypothetical protein
VSDAGGKSVGFLSESLYQNPWSNKSAGTASPATPDAQRVALANEEKKMSHDAYHAGPKQAKKVTGNKGETQLFLVRLWLEDDPHPGGTGSEPGKPDQEGVVKWQGKVQHVVRGEAHAFTGWDMLVGQLEAMLLSNRPNQAGAKTIGTQVQEQTEGTEGTEGTEANRGSSGALC